MIHTFDCADCEVQREHVVLLNEQATMYGKEIIEATRFKGAVEVAIEQLDISPPQNEKTASEEAEIARFGNDSSLKRLVDECYAEYCDFKRLEGQVKGLAQSEAVEGGASSNLNVNTPALYEAALEGGLWRLHGIQRDIQDRISKIGKTLDNEEAFQLNTIEDCKIAAAKYQDLVVKAFKDQRKLVNSNESVQQCSADIEKLESDIQEEDGINSVLELEIARKSGELEKVLQQKAAFESNRQQLSEAVNFSIGRLTQCVSELSEK